MKQEIKAKSFTYAMKGKKLLEKRGFSAEVVKKAEDCGCVYAIRFDDRGKSEPFAAWLRESGVLLKD